MFKVLHIDHLVLRVTDLPAMLRFYCDALGCSRSIFLNMALRPVRCNRATVPKARGRRFTSPIRREISSS